MLKTVSKFISPLKRCVPLHNRRTYSQADSSCPPITEKMGCSVLCNGVKIITEETLSPLACVSLFIEAGSRYETTRNNGICHFIEHMAYKGFCSMDQFQLETFVAQDATRLTAYTGREIQVFSAICPSERAPYYVELLSLIITDLELNDFKISSERDTIFQEMEDLDRDPKEVVFDYLHATAFQGTPLSKRVIGPTKNVCQFDRNSVLNFLCEHYQPHRLVLATSGKVVHEQLASCADLRMSCIPCAPYFDSEDGPCRFTGSEVRYRDDSMPLCHVAIAFEAPGYASKDYMTMMVMKHMVGSWDRSQSRGVDNSRWLARKGASVCHKYECFYIPYRDVGLWGVYFVAGRTDLEDMLYLVQTEFMNLCFIKHNSEVLKGVNGAKLEMYKRYSSAVSSSLDIGTQVMYTGDRHDVVELCGFLSDVNYHTIWEAAQHYLYDRCPAVAAVGPTEGLPDYTRIRAGTYWLRL